MRGFTLLEAVITAGIGAFLIAALSTIFVSFNSLYGYGLSYHAASDTVGNVIHAVEESVTPADHVLTNHTFSGTTYSSSASTLVLELPAVSTNGSVIAGVYDYVAFYTVGSTTYRLTSLGSGSARRAGTFILGTNVTRLTFTYDSATYAMVSTVTTDVSASSTIKGKSGASHATLRVRLRNF